MALLRALVDALLIAAGVRGMAEGLGERPGLARALARVGGHIPGRLWVARIGTLQAQHSLSASTAPQTLTLGAAPTQAAALTLLNPHAYLDTVLLVRSIGGQQPEQSQGWFIAGASCGSFL